MNTLFFKLLGKRLPQLLAQLVAQVPTLELIPRTDSPPWMAVLTPVIAVFATVLMGALVFTILGYNAADTLYHFFIASFNRPDRIADLLVKACPLIIIALGLIFCYRANIWNIGAEGQFIIGALASGAFVLAIPETALDLLPWPLVFGAMFIVSMIAGAAWAAIAGFLRAFLNVNEILVTLMLVYIARLLLDFMVRGPLRDPDSFGFPVSPHYPDAALIDKIPLPFYGTLGQLHYGFLIAILLAVLAWWALKRTTYGFIVDVVGSAPRAGQFAGFSEKTTFIAVLLLSGALAGLGGMIEVSANIGQLQPDVSFGYGFTAIIVAFLAQLNPLAVIPAGLVIAIAEVGGDNAQIAIGIPKSVTGLFQGVLLFFLLATATLQRYQIVWRGGSRP